MLAIFSDSLKGCADERCGMIAVISRFWRLRSGESLVKKVLAYGAVCGVYFLEDFSGNDKV